MKKSINTQHDHMRPHVTLNDITIELPEPIAEEEYIPQIKINIPVEGHFKVHSDMNVTVALAETGDENWYLLSKHVAENYSKKLWSIRYATLYLCINEQDEFFLLPIFAPKVIPQADNVDKLQDAIDFAIEGNWITLRYNSISKEYSFEGESTEDEKWPTVKIDDILDAAFPGELYIDSVDNQILRNYLYNVDLMAKID